MHTICATRHSISAKWVLNCMIEMLNCVIVSQTYVVRHILADMNCVMSPENSTLSGGKSLMYRRLYLMMVSDRNLPTLCLTSPATSGCVAASVMNTRCRGEPRLCWNTEASILDTIELSMNLHEVS